MIDIKEVKSKSDLKKFIKLPYELHKDHKEWTPPLISDEYKIFDKNKNHSFKSCETILLLAYIDNKIVGRIMGIINPFYNRGQNEKNARFYALESIDNSIIVEALLTEVELWALKKSMHYIVGPLGFSDMDPQGFLYEGFKNDNTVMVTNCSFPFFIDHLNKFGYSKKIDLFQYRSEINKEIQVLYENNATKVKNDQYELLEFTKSKAIKPFVSEIFSLINETYTSIYGFAPLNDIEIKEFSERYLPLLNPNFIKIVTKKETKKVIGFIVAMPDISIGLKKAKGKLFPIGFYHILRSIKKTDQLNLLLGSVQKDERNKIVTTLLASSMLTSAYNSNLTFLNSHLIMEDNIKMRQVMERLNGVIYKKYRVFEKKLN